MHAYFDIHCHMLSGVDDGPKSEKEMCAMLDMAYADGVRAICLTPHFAPYLFGDTHASSARSFEVLSAYAAQRYPDLFLCLGHELGYHEGCIEVLESGRCRTMGQSRYVLVDFLSNVGFYEIETAMTKLMCCGFHPILAHAERYSALFDRLEWLTEFVMRGGKVQVNAASVTGVLGFRVKQQWKRLIKKRLVHLIGSDGHNLSNRKPQMSVCMKHLERYCDADYIKDLTWNNACRVIGDAMF